MSQSTALLVLLCFLSLPAASRAQLVPTAPGPGDVYPAGGPCPISWTPDPTGTWTNMTVRLMSGQNMAMTPVTTVATGIDGTNPALSPFSWICPEVDPYSAIYFYEFSQPGTASPAWTTRFAISNPSGTVDPPQYANQPSGDAVPWGNGQLALASATNTTDGNSTLALPSAAPSQSGLMRAMQPSSTTVQTWMVLPVQSGVVNGSVMGFPGMMAFENTASRSGNPRLVVAAQLLATIIALWAA